ncbi:LysR substrate-binding domain-containing protein [Ornithinimicrobium cerasi]|uniref:DNA-binding transcriptional regulator, LysR family n=1 Tax=Ornithinimicrobium cerasi TaxID=2248773 RepID=A0A285VRP3_9MICO|nr:LysR substrate-binding domain-containing protein [Ornithinimicrobium cerasi]SOC55896.1 DNA-binding transcriptional regulator, LysR family [Ornithinimicrobium cerasi]
MDVRDLRWFQQVADGVTLTELSDLESVSQSGISRALARLDVEVGTPLLRRSGRTLRMTRAGLDFKRHVDGALHELDDGLAAVHQLLDPESGTVSLAFQPSLGTWLVPGLVSGFRKAHPGVDVVLTSKHLDELTPAVGGRSGVELELTTRPPQDASVRWQVLVRESLMLAVGPDHPWAHRERVDLAEAAQEAFVATHPLSHLWEVTLGLCRQAGFAPQVTLASQDLPTARAFVAAGLGVAVLPVPDAWVPTHEGLHQLPLEGGDAYRDVGIAWSTEQRMLPSARVFLEHAVGQTRAGEGLSA